MSLLSCKQVYIRKLDTSPPEPFSLPSPHGKRTLRGRQHCTRAYSLHLQSRVDGATGSSPDNKLTIQKHIHRGESGRSTFESHTGHSTTIALGTTNSSELPRSRVQHDEGTINHHTGNRATTHTAAPGTGQPVPARYLYHSYRAVCQRWRLLHSLLESLLPPGTEHGLRREANSVLHTPDSGDRHTAAASEYWDVADRL